MPYKFTKRELNRSVFTNGKLIKKSKFSYYYFD